MLLSPSYSHGFEGRSHRIWGNWGTTGWIFTPSLLTTFNTGAPALNSTTHAHMSLCALMNLKRKGINSSCDFDHL